VILMFHKISNGEFSEKVKNRIQLAVAIVLCLIFAASTLYAITKIEHGEYRYIVCAIIFAVLTIIITIVTVVIFYNKKGKKREQDGNEESAKKGQSRF